MKLTHPMKQQAARRKAPDKPGVRTGRFSVGGRTARKPRVKFTCLECGKEFTTSHTDAVKRTRATKLPGLFCRKECHTAYLRKRRQEAQG